uniref:Uncharacterized protein n=1 Tax=Avena sativa TaxID=4498 RepID=A0ACD6A2Q1_AVESA
MAAPPSRYDSPPGIPDHLVEEILIRLPPDEPSCLLRASFACKTFRRAVSSPGFRRRFIELHRHQAPPLIGFLHNWEDERISRFVPTTSSPFSLAAPDLRSWQALDCRHGRALFLSKGQGTRELLLWEPTMGSQQRVPVPAAFQRGHPTAAVVCSVDGCDHRHCQGGPFRLVFVFQGPEVGDWAVTKACLYRSETGTWGGLTSCLYGIFDMTFTDYSSVLIGRSLLYFMSDGGTILQYDLSRHRLTGFDPPSYAHEQTFCLMRAKNGGLGVSAAFSTNLKLWSMEAIGETDARWIPSRLICIHKLLPISAPVDAKTRVSVLGFAEGANVIFVNTAAGLFSIELRSNRARKVCDDHDFCNLIPVVSFYTPVPHCEDKDLLLLNPSEDSGRLDGGEQEEKTVDLAHQSFNNGSNAIMEGDLASTS